MRIRVNADGGLASPGLNAAPDFGELTVSSALTVTTPTTATDIKGGTMAVGNSSGLALSASAGSITIRRPGLYLVYYNISECTGVNSAVWTFDVYKNAAVASPAVKTGLTHPATAVVRASFNAIGVLSLTKNDVLTFRATADTGSVVFPSGRFGAYQLLDLPAVTVTGE